MLRRLIVMRHAKSSWEAGVPTDHARPLNKRGRRDAPRIADRLAEREWIPEFVFSSDSNRTTETFELMAPQFPSEPPVEFLDLLYHSGPNEVMQCVSNAPENISTVMVLGHNPGWEAVVHWLSGEAITMTTANAALLQIESDDWGDALQRDGLWELVEVIRPKELD